MTRVADVNDQYSSFVLERAVPPLEERLDSFTIITTKPNELTTVRHRMPVILYPEGYGEWLMRVDGEDPQANLLRPYPAEEMKAKAAFEHIRNVRNNHPELLNSCLMRIHVWKDSADIGNRPEELIRNEDCLFATGFVLCNIHRISHFCPCRRYQLDSLHRPDRADDSRTVCVWRK